MRPVGVENYFVGRLFRVGAAHQLWAEGWNPVGIRSVQAIFPKCRSKKPTRAGDMRWG